MRCEGFGLMRSAVQFVVLSLAIAGATCGRAQISNPNDMVSGPPKPPPVRQRARGVSSGSLQWIWRYTQPVPNGNAVALREDERFAALLAASFKQQQAFWGKNVPLATAIPRFLARYGEVNTKDNRYVIVDGCVPSFCAAHGLLWVDLSAADPLLVFAAVNWTGEGRTTDDPEAAYDLWLFTNRQVSADALPLAMTEAIADWDARLASAHRGVPHVVHALLVEPDGQRYAVKPTLVGANTMPPQPDTITPKPSDDQ